MIFPIDPEKVYVVGAAGWWLEKWRVSDHDREVKVSAAFHRRFGKRIESERQKISKIESTVHQLVN